MSGKLASASLIFSPPSGQLCYHYDNFNISFRHSEFTCVVIQSGSGSTGL